MEKETMKKEVGRAEAGLTKEARKVKAEERLKAKLEQAKRENSIVVIAQTKRVVTLLNLLAQTDLGLTRVQNNLGNSISVEEGVEIFDKFNSLIKDVEEFTKGILKLSNSPYYETASIKELNSKHITEATPKKAKSKEGGKE